MPDNKAITTWLDREEAARAMQHLGEDDLLFLNAQIVERLKLLAQAQSTVQLARFKLGDRVSFPGSTGKTVHGTIIKLNKKSAGVQTNDGQQCNVAPTLLAPKPINSIRHF
jgi:hypothetical protein